MAQLVGTATGEAGLPPRPDPALWPYLDAAARCIGRFGLARTSVRDVAAEAGVERTTVYRHVGSMEHIFGLLVARELHTFMEQLPAAVPPGCDGPDFLVELLATAIEHALGHPVLAKVLADEPDVVGQLLSRGLGDLVQRVATTLEPLLVSAMDSALIARRDPRIVTEWATRVGLSVLVAAPPGDLRRFLREVLHPVLALQRP